MPQKKTKFEFYEKCGTRRVPRAHRHTLAEMNRSVYTARRDAAHARVVEILAREMLTNSKERRASLYRKCHQFLQEAVYSTERSQVQQDSPVLHYLELLRETIGACMALVNHELKLVMEAEEFSRFLGRETVDQLLTATDVFSQSEMHVLDCIDGLLKFGMPIIEHDSAALHQRFTEDDERRYALARKEYDHFYLHSDPEAETECEPADHLQ